MRRRLLALGLWLACVAPLAAEEPPVAPAPFTPADRALILRTELRRGPASDLAPYLAVNATAEARTLALRALGRIGDRAGATARLLEFVSGPGRNLREALVAAGLNGSAQFEELLTEIVGEGQREAPTALEALGWVAAQALSTVPGTLSNALAQRVAAVAAAQLESSRSELRAAALTALALARQEGDLERVLTFLDDASPEVVIEAQFAGWFLAGARKRAAGKLFKDSWSGSEALAAPLAARAGAAPAEHALALIRIFASLLPATAPPASEALRAAVAALLGHADARVVEEAVARLLTGRTGPWLESLLPGLLAHGDPKVRGAAYELLSDKERGAGVLALLKARVAEEQDARLRDALAAALCANADEAGARALLADTARRSPDPLLRALGEAKVLGVAACSASLTDLVALARQHQGEPAVVLEVLSQLESRNGEALRAFIDECLGHPDAYVRASAAGFVGKQRTLDLLPRVEALYRAPAAPAERDLPQAVVEVWAELLKSGPKEDPLAPALRAKLLAASREGPTFTARAAAIQACRERRIAGAPEADLQQPNDWQGLPRPKAAVLGLDLSQGQGLLTEAEILALAERLRAEQPEFVVQTAQGAFRLKVDPSEAPVHAVAFLLNVAAGTYADTLWHRVVPSFVIQGGDPHGTGNGDAGYGLPDEITARRFLRGALGMPKGEIRDTGGCQLFFMHSPYRPLDGRYTCYGEVLEGMETVDRIRVGDRTLGVQMVLAGR